MNDWDYGRCKSFFDEVVNELTSGAVLLERQDRTSFDVRAMLRRVDSVLTTLRKVKALLVRERKSRA
jgi:hypothetical protein